MSKWHHQSRDALNWGLATSDPSAPPAIGEGQYKQFLTDTNGVLYVFPLISGGGGTQTLPTATLGIPTGPNTDTLLASAAGIGWTGDAGGEGTNNWYYVPLATSANMRSDGYNNISYPQLVRKGGDWAITHQPAAGVRATISRAAEGNVRHVCTSITASLCVDPANAPQNIILNLRDGATGAGTILWSRRLANFDVTNGGCIDVAISDLSIVGSINTAMTLEFAAAPGGASFETVAMTGMSAGL